MVRALTYLVLLALCIPCPADAVTFELTATLDEAQANTGHGTGSRGTGHADITYDDGTGLLSWTISYNNLRAMGWK